MKEFKGYRVLLADDEVMDLEVVSHIVEELGAECVTAKNGDEILSILNSPDGEKIDLVLTDINMPGKSGIDACLEFRASSHPRAKTLPIIGISADTNPTIFDRAISVGMNSMTMKPLTRDTLFAHFHITLKDNKANLVFSDRIQQALAKTLFFSTVSHDIRTPLNSIVCFSEMLKQGFESKAEEELAIDSILVSSKMLMQLVNDILDLTKLESGRMNIEPMPTDVEQLVREIALSFGATHHKVGLEVLCHVAGVPMLVIDPHRMRQIAFNLISNAIKFTKRGHIEVRARFIPDASNEKGTFRLEVEDTGCGISEADMKKLASPFAQFGDVAERRGGTGLGLHICRLLARAMGGEMEVVSTLGKGSTFSIVIPGVKVAPSSASNPAANPASGSSSSSIASLRVLVADDTKMNQIVLRSMFARLGVTDIAFADNGREALDILLAPDAPKFDFVLTDMWMPEMDGLKLVKAIRENPSIADEKVYLFTAEVEMKDSYAQCGFDGILLKPANLEALRRLLP
jgi:CheY-like chemotaxis protein